MAFVKRKDAECSENVCDESTKLVRARVECVGNVGDEIRMRYDLRETNLEGSENSSGDEIAQLTQPKRLTSVFMSTRKHLSISD